MPEVGTVLLVEDLGLQRLPARRLAAELAQAGFTPRLAHFGGETEVASALLQAGADLRPRLVVISQLFEHLLAQHLELAAGLRRTVPGVHISIAGPLPSMAWREVLEAAPSLDSVLTGEAEAGITGLARTAASDAGWGDVPGLAWRNPKPVRNPPSPPLDLDRLPLPLYAEGLPSWSGVPFATVESSRGCWHRCSFCLPCAEYARQRAPYRDRSVVPLTNELAERWRQGARLILFDDEQFLPPAGVRAGRVEALGRELAARGVAPAFTIKCRADEVEPALFARLREMGLARVYLGMESNDQATLDCLAKGTTPAANRRALETLAALGLVADVRCLISHPWSTVAGIGREIAALRGLLDMLPTCLSFWDVAVYPSTPLAARLRAEGRAAPALSPLDYASRDLAAETFRRLRRLAIDGCQPYRRLCERLSLLWFGAMLAMRGLAPPDFPTRAALRRAARTANEAALDTLAEIWESVERSPGDAGRLADGQAAEWSAELARRSAQAAEEMAG